MAKSKGSKFNAKSTLGNSTQSSALIAKTNSGASSNLKISASADLQRLSSDDRRTARAIEFGSPSRATTTHAVATGSSWTNLLEKTASGSISDLLGEGGPLSSGVSYLVSGLSKLLGGSSEPAVQPLVRFALPESQDQTLYSNGNGLSSVQSSITRQESPVYGGSQGTSYSEQAQKAQMVQTIRNAILTSSSLNDVIGEL